LAAATYHKQTNKQTNKPSPLDRGRWGTALCRKLWQRVLPPDTPSTHDGGWHYYRRLVEDVAKILAVLQRWLLRQESFQIVSSSRACGFRAALRR
jgi:hypothetical protein